MFYVLEHLLIILFIFILFFFTGALLLPSKKDNSFLYPVSYGIVAWISIVFFLGCTENLSSEIFIGLTGAIFLFSVIKKKKIIEHTGHFFKAETESNKKSETGIWIPAICFFAFCLVLFFLTILPEISWDASVYHLTIPKRYIQQNGFYRIPFLVYSNWPLNMELLYALALGISDFVTAKLLHFLMGILTAITIFNLIKRETQNLKTAFFGVFLFFLNPVVAEEMHRAYVELGITFFLGMMLLAMDGYLKSGNKKYLWRIIIFSGIVSGIKIQAFFIAFCLLLPFFVILRHERGFLIKSFGILAGTVLMIIPWLLKTWIYTGNPFYPFCYSVFGGPEWSEELSQAFFSWHQSLKANNPGGLLVTAKRLFFNRHWPASAFPERIFSYSLIIFPVAFIFFRKNRLLRLSAIACLFQFGFWISSSQQGRFLIPFLFFLSISGGIVFHYFLESLKSKKLVSPKMISALSSFILLILGLKLLLMSFTLASPKLFAFSILSGSDPVISSRSYMYDKIHEWVPVEKKVLMCNINQYFYVDRECIGDSFFEASQVSWVLKQCGNKENVRQWIKNEKIGAILISHQNWSIDYPHYWNDYLTSLQSYCFTDSKGWVPKNLAGDENYFFELYLPCQ